MSTPITLPHDGDEAEFPLKAARDQLGDLVNRVVYTSEPVHLTRRGRRVATLVSSDVFERLVELAEDALDIRAAHEARERVEAGEETVAWEDVKRDLGL